MPSSFTRLPAIPSFYGPSAVSLLSALMVSVSLLPQSARAQSATPGAVEEVVVVAAGPFGAEPLLVQVGFTRFALRRAEAARVHLRTHGALA